MMRRPTKLGRGRGFSLLEVIIGLTILSAGVVAVMGVYPYVLKGQSDAELLTLAASLAQMKAEEIRRDDDHAGTLVGEIGQLTEPTTPIVFLNDARLAYSFSGRSVLYQGVDASDPRGLAGVARVLIRFAPDFRPTQDVIYELRFN